MSFTELGADTCLRFSVVVRPKVSFIMIEYGVSARIPSSARGQNVLASPAQRASGEDAGAGRGCGAGQPRGSGRRAKARSNFPGGADWPQAELQVVFSGEWFPWLGTEKGSWEDNYVEAWESFMASDPLPNSLSAERPGRVAEAHRSGRDTQPMHRPGNECPLAHAVLCTAPGPSRSWGVTLCPSGSAAAAPGSSRCCGGCALFASP